VYSTYQNPELDPWRREILPLLKRIPASVLSEGAQISQRAIHSIGNGYSLPSPKTRDFLLKTLENHSAITK